VRALKERLDQNLELIFRLLGLQYPQKDIYFAYTALRGNRGERRGAAIEFLDNLLQKDLKAVILPLLEERSAERLIDRASTLFGIEAKSRGEALRLILEQSDAWLKACALHEVGERRVTELAGHCSRLAGDTDPIVRETAHWALRVLAGA
jgi:AAA family ATP:ADP antiporter